MTTQITLQSHIPEYQEGLRRAVQFGTQQSALLVQSVAKRLVRVETGSLQETIDIEKLMDSGDTVTWSINAGNTGGGFKGGGEAGKLEGAPVDYAAAQEYGGTDSSYTPFMTPAAEIAAQEGVQGMADQIRSVIV